MPASKRLVQRHPLAWGITKWGPLPDTADMWILWGGPGDVLELFTGDPSKMGSHGRRIQHDTASGTYATVAQAEKAVNAFVQAGIT